MALALGNLRASLNLSGSGNLTPEFDVGPWGDLLGQEAVCTVRNFLGENSTVAHFALGGESDDKACIVLNLLRQYSL